ncbi:MAG: HutD family protein [Comamonadaceae bacterium]|nr:MAG: HutD family protein [Comamonadaceae bacterium]
MSDSAQPLSMTSMHTQPGWAFTPFTLAQLPAVPWKNGGGTTREIACWPADSDMNTFDWRISVARIDRDGPFSAFDGIDRVITLLDGAGVRLGGVDHTLSQPLSPYAFDGAAAVHGELIDGPCEDLNIMSRRAHIDADVRALRATTRVPGAPAGMLLAVHSAWQISSADGVSLRLAPGTGIWWHAPLSECTVTPETASPAGLIAVAFRDTHHTHRSGGGV